MRHQDNQNTMFNDAVLWILRKISWKFGYVVMHNVVEPLPTHGDDPREIPYLQDLPYAVQNMPAELGLGLRFYSFTGDTYHPFIVALRAVRQNQNQESFAYSVLEKFNQLCPLQNANDFLGLNSIESCFPNGSHPYELTYPWSPLLPNHVRRHYLEGVREENRKYGFDSLDAIDLPNASTRKLWIETKRLVQLMATIEQEGFKAKSHDSLGCFVLVKGEEWRWFVHGGQHRAAVMAALGYKTIPANVRRIIRREDVDVWPQVQSGLFTRAKALLVFDRLFSAEPPACAEEWMDYVDQTFYQSGN